MAFNLSGKMNTAPASEAGPYSTNHTRPFFYAQPTAQQPFPNPWYLSQVYNPYCMPAPGFRNGNPYFPFYSVALHEYPGYFVPQHPMHTRVNRRPYFNAPPPSPMFYHATRFRHYSSPGRRTETKETQTDPRQPENKAKKHQAPRIETKGCDAGNMACVSSGIGTETDSTSEKQDSSGSSIVPERGLHKSPSSTAQYRNLPSGSYAFEKEEVRIEYGNGSPAIQLWKSFKETIPLYDVASGKPVPENIVQRDLFSVSSCEGLIYGPHEAEALMPSTYSDECKALPSKQSIDVLQEREVQNNEAKLEVEKLGNASQKAKSPQGEARAVQITDLASSICNDQSVARQDTLIISKISSSSKRSTGSKASQDESSLTQQAVLFPSNMEITNDMFLQQKKLNQSHSVTSGSQMTLDKSLWCDESVEKFVPSNSWLAGLDNMDTNCNYDMRFPQRKHQNVLSVSSDEMSSKEEGSSIDNAPVSYFVPDYVLQKSMYTLQKNTDDLEKEKIKSSGSLNEDEEQVDGEQTNDGNSQNFKSCSNLKIKDLSSRGKKMGSLPRSSSKKKIYSLKKKAVKSLSLSEVDDSEEFSVVEDEEDEDDLDEIEYFFHGATPYEMLTPSKGSFYHQIGQRMLWKPPKNSVPAQLISWPAREKVKLKSALGEIGLFCKPKEKDQDEVVYSDYGYYERKRPAAKREGLLKEGSDHKRPPQKRSGGRLLKENVGLAVEDYWIRSGAKPKLSSLIRSSLSPPAKMKEQGRGTKRAVYRRR
ncbi:uncharacterized protein LOC102566107 isoform X4 [Alligator mississippiensis]|uniref:Bucky ball isoform B n=1 Tax=Alligator mississippiensis TaxID=8496 RepID=A0A151P2D4_ALLMI|nr:uncharacterized protein LOC102566107 isoform X4 [Alligator mississippiensis]KYO43247.1 bucky ball isoform B [Alligator mississippiensis]